MTGVCAPKISKKKMKEEEEEEEAGVLGWYGMSPENGHETMEERRVGGGA